MNPLYRLAAVTTQIVVKVLDRLGRPLTGIDVAVPGLDLVGTTNGDGIVVIPLPSGPVRVEVTVALPEGTASREVVSTPAGSGAVEIFQSLAELPKPFVTLPEGLAFAIGLGLTTTGLLMKDGKAEEVLIGMGSGLAGIAGFSFVWRHLS